MAIKTKNVYAYTSSVGMLKSRTALLLSHWNTHCMWRSTLIRSGLVVKQCVRYAANTWMWN